MGENYFLYYAEANVVCIIILGILLYQDLRKGNRQEKQIKFDYALIAQVLYYLSDIMWAGVLSGSIVRTRFSVVALNFLNSILLSAIAYTWLQFVAASEDMSLRLSRKGRLLMRLPMIANNSVLVLVYSLAPKFWVNEALQVEATYYLILLSAPFIYVIWALRHSVKKARKEENPDNRRMFRLIGRYPLIICVCGLVQILFFDVPMLCFAATITMVYFYIQSVDSQISIDPLTRLNNRNQLYRYIAQENARRKDGKKTYVAMIDLNDFKQINDTFGHAEGDKALVALAESLKSALETLHMQAFLGRYGGDEFIVIAHAERDEDMNFFAYEVRRRLEEKCQAMGAPYMLSIGVGYDEYHKEEETFQKCMQRADEKLYTDKELEKRKLRESGQRIIL